MGTGRNGSALLLRLLDGSPDLWVYPIELNYLRMLGKRRKKKHLLLNKIRNRVFGFNYDDYFWFQFIASQIDELQETYLDKLQAPLEPNGSSREFFFDPKYWNKEHNLYKFLKSFQLTFDDRENQKFFFTHI